MHLHRISKRSTSSMIETVFASQTQPFRAFYPNPIFYYLAMKMLKSGGLLVYRTNNFRSAFFPVIILLFLPGSNARKTVRPNLLENMNIFDSQHRSTS